MKKILIIEDDHIMAKIYHDLLIESGYEVEIAYDGEEGLEKTRNVKPSLVLLDILLPKLNGNQVLERLKTDPETKNIPVIILTNVNDIRNAQMAIQTGAIKYLVKSEFDPDKTSTIIEDVLNLYGTDSRSSAS